MLDVSRRSSIAAVFVLGMVYHFIGATPSFAQSSGLVAAYSFNEGTGTTVTDLSGNNITGTIRGATWTTQGKYGNALSFNGSSSYVDLGNPTALRLTGSMTIEAWINATSSPPDDGQIVAKSNNSSGWQFKTSPDTGPHRFGVAVSGSNSSRTQRYSTTTRSLNTWYHVAGVYDASARTLNIYVNGVLDNGTLVGTVPASQVNNNVNVNIGRRTGGFYFNGRIDEVRIYSRALSATEIQTDMNTPVGAPPDTEPPTAPASLAASAFSPTQINLSWAASTDNVGVTGYLVESCLTSSCSYTQIASTTATSYNNTGLLAGTGYSYRVRATDAAGNLSSYSDVASTTTPSTDTQPPTAPSNLVATAVSSSQINLSWTASTDNVGIHGYSVERCLTTSCSFAVIAPYVTSTVYNDIGLSPGTSYNYRVQASDSAGNPSPYSNVATAATPALDTQPPTAPTNLTATAAGANEIDLSWTASTDNIGVTGYLVESCLTASCTFTQIATTTTTSYNNTGLSSGTRYSYQVRATDAAGNFSPYSNGASATTPATTPGLVAAFSFNEGTGTTVADSSGNGNNGTITNGTWTTSGRFANALVFNGSNALVTIPDASSLHLTAAMTLEAWVNPSAVNSTWRDVIYKGNDNYYLEGTSTSNSAPAIGGTFGGANANVYGTAGLAVNTWAHLAATYDGSTLRLYVNGTQVSSTARTGSIATSTNPLQIGGDSIYGQYFNGLIDEVRIYNVALTQAQIQSDMNTPIGASTPSPAVTLSSTSVVFGNQATGTTSTAQPVTITNTGAASLAIAGIAVTGANSADFAQTNNCGTSLAPGANCTISITFTPTTTGTRVAAVAITDNAPLSPQTINLTGTGVGFSVSPRVTVLTSTMTQQFTAVNGMARLRGRLTALSAGLPLRERSPAPVCIHLLPLLALIL